MVTLRRAVSLLLAVSMTALQANAQLRLRAALGAALKGPSWGRYAGARLDAKARREAEEAVAGYSAEDAAAWRQAVEDLWRLLGHPDPKVSTSALYAVAERPAYFLGLESRLAAALADPASPQHAAALRLLGMTEPGFSPLLAPWAAGLPLRRPPAAAFGGAATPPLPVLSRR